MKVFFSSSPRSLKSSNDALRKIYHEIEKLGHQHLSKLVIENDASLFYNLDSAGREKHFSETMNHIQNSDVVVVEASIHSLAIGYIVERALNLSKQVIVLYADNKEPFFFSGSINERLQVIDYTMETMVPSLKEAFNYAQNAQDIRFNMIFSSKLNNFIKKVAETKNISRASYIRSLINEQMEK